MKKKKKSQAWQFDGSAPPAWGMGRGARRDCPGCSPTVVGGTLRPFPNGHSCMQSCLLLFPSSPSFSQWFGWNNVFYSNDPRFHLILPLQELSASHLAALESPNDWLGNRLLEKHLQVVLKGWLPHQAAGKACKVPPAGPKAGTLFPQLQRQVEGQEITRGAAARWPALPLCVCVGFWLIGVFCFCVCSVLTKGLLPAAAWKLLNSVLDHFILLKPFQQNGQNHQLVAGVKSNSMTTFKYWLVWE